MRKMPLMVGLVGLISLLSAGGIASAQVPTLSRETDRDQWRIEGPVAKMTAEFTVFRRDSDHWVESPRQLEYSVEFGRAGDLIKVAPQPKFGDPIAPAARCRLRYVYDEKRRPVEEYQTCDAENLIKKFSYENDAQGNWVKKVTYVVIAGTGEIRKQSVNYRTFVYFD